MLKSLIIVVAIAVAGLLIFAATKPDTFRVQRTATIEAPPEKIFALINDFRSWSQWSPYEKLDPAMQRTYSEPASGVGASYEWSGNGKAGAGSMQITKVLVPSKLALSLNFTKPFAAHNIVEFTLQPTADPGSQQSVTTVTWAMRGPVPYAAKIMHTIFNVDEMVGKDFETGLADLKRVAEK